MREIIKQAATVEEAIELALKELGLTRGQVTCEVLEYPERKFLFMKKPAKVKVSEIEEEFSVKDLFEDAKPKAEKPAKQEKKAEKPAKPAKKQEQPKAEPVKETKPQVEEIKAEAETEVAAESEETNLEEISVENYPAKVKYSMEFISSVIDQFYTGSYSYKVYKTQTGFIIKILGDDAGCLIGRKGETMEALSYLTSLAANRFEDSDEKISVDVADYRQKREKDLQQLAKKMAAKVAKSGRSYSFEPMNPYERRIIHATVSEMEGVKSESKGEGSQRRVVIYSTAPRKNNSHKGGRPNGKGGRNDRRRDRKEKPAPQVQKTREEKLVDDFGGTGLYGKIEL
ncbi:MAG: Jag N-terminal domain-containing protein [Oscillospiraceae bacterium]|nr:Jag N-terminal domain-containing protein [Oscillospiraceae bacterium]